MLITRKYTYFRKNRVQIRKSPSFPIFRGSGSETTPPPPPGSAAFVYVTKSTRDFNEFQVRQIRDHPYSVKVLNNRVQLFAK